MVGHYEGLKVKWQQDRYISCLKGDHVKDHEGDVSNSTRLRNVSKNTLNSQ